MIRLAALLLFSACSEPSATPFPSVDDTPLEVGLLRADTVARDATLRLVFDDYIDPDSARFPAVVLRSGTLNFDIAVSVDLVRREVRVQPRQHLVANTLYELLVSPNLRALSGRSVQTIRAFEVPVGEDLEPVTAAAAPLVWADVRGVLGGCAIFCHSPVGRTGAARAPTRQLDLTGPPDDPVYGLIGVPAEGSYYGRQVRVASGDAARSLLLRKLLGGVRGANDPFYPAMQVDGRRMPIELEGMELPPPPLTDDELLRIQQWIDDGARVN